MSTLAFKDFNSAISQYDLILFDLWGVIIEGDSTYPGVVDAINKVITLKEVIFLSNAPRPAFKVVETLRSWGITNVTKEMILTAGDIARDIIEENGIVSKNKTPIIYHLGADRNNDMLLNIDHKLTNDINEADILLLSIYRDEHENIHEFNHLLQEAAHLPSLLKICCNPDTTIPKHGLIRFCAGYFADIIEKFGGEVIYTGKPKSAIYDAVFERKPQIKKNRILMVGDTFETDVLGAANAGIDSALVLSGNTKIFHLQHEFMTDKLLALSSHAKQIDITPTFVTSIV